MRKYIPDWHFVNPAEKLTPAWCFRAVRFCFNQSQRRYLLQDKKVDEIDGFAIGKFDMKPYKRLFKSLRKNQDKEGDGNFREVPDTTGIDWTPLPLIPARLNSAKAVINKIPLEVEVQATDALAAEKKKEDITFLKAKPKAEKDLQPLADSLGVGKVDLGTTKHSDVPYSDSPFGLDLSQPDQSDVFENLIYSLNTETAFETAITHFNETTRSQQIEMLETLDQLK